MTRRSTSRLLGLLCCVIALGCASTKGVVPEPAPTALRAFVGRVAVARTQLPQIIAASEAAARRKVEHPDALVNLNYHLQPSFGEEDEAAVNVLANVVNGWLWVCEYSAALTRQGKHHGILQSITTAGSRVHNGIYQERQTRHHIYPCETAVPAGDLSRIYLRRVDRLLENLQSQTTRSQIDRDADVIAQRLRSGGEVLVSTNTHMMLNDIAKNNKTPWTPINTPRRMREALAAEAKPGDLFFWLSFNGVSIWWCPGNGPSELYIDYDTAIRESKVDLVTCFARDPLHPNNNGHGALAHIEQNWDYGDAEVAVPFPPGRIAPISGLYQGLLYRMLDDVVAAKLKL